MTDRDDLPTVDGDKFNPDAYGVPTTRVRVVDGMEMMKPSQNGAPQQMNDMFDVEVPDMERIETFLQRKQSMGLGQLNLSAMEEKKRAIEAKTWEAIREIGRESDIKHVDASGEESFSEVLYDAVHTIEQQAGAPEDAEIFVSPKSNYQVQRWMDRDTRLNAPTTDLDSLTGPKSVRIAGFDLNFIETEFMNDGELVVGDPEELYAAPHNRPFAYVTNLPIGVEVTINVNGTDNEIEVDK